MKTANPNAYPGVVQNIGQGGKTLHAGMTLRDYMAGQALAVAAKDRDTITPGWQKNLAWTAYSLADAMLRERQEGTDT